MIEVKVNPKESVETALARFKQICRRAKIRDEVRKRRFYEKPSTKRRRLALKAKRKQQRNNRLQEHRRVH
jgi:small subunit ribosomal protein S21